MDDTVKFPWNHWYHVSGSTYGQWLRGDPRGWRARWHREHVDGDYKNPPPKGKYDTEFERSKQLMKRERVKLDVEQRELACRVMVETLKKLGVEVIDWCVGAKHYHGLVRCTPLGQPLDTRAPRLMVGRAKGASARALSKAGLVPLGGVWALKCKAKLVTDRTHQVNTAGYIKDHVKQGAVVYSLLMKRDAEQRNQSQG
jgi:REP element-mobilizing transposase RayT